MPPAPAAQPSPSARLSAKSGRAGGARPMPASAFSGKVGASCECQNVSPEMTKLLVVDSREAEPRQQFLAALERDCACLLYAPGTEGADVAWAAQELVRVAKAPQALRVVGVWTAAHSELPAELAAGGGPGTWSEAQMAELQAWDGAHDSGSEPRFS